MTLGKLNALFVGVLIAAACQEPGPWWWHVPHGGGGDPLDDDGGADEARLENLPLSEAPAPSQRFASWTMFWGTLDVSAPGFVGPPRDVLTLALDANNHPRYLSWRTLPSFPKVFGDADGEFPLSGSKRVAPEGYSVVFQATVLEAPEPTADHFLIRMQLVSEDGITDYVESIEGTARQGGWDVVYREHGRYFGATIDAHAGGLLTTREPNVEPVPQNEGSFWSAPVEVVSPGFVGEPVDHLSIALAADGSIQSLAFETFPRTSLSFGGGPDDLPLVGEITRGELTVTVDPAVEATAEHFVLRYHVVDPSRSNDFREGVEGARAGDTLHVRYFIVGTLWGASIDAHAAGPLYPAAVRGTP